MKYSVNQLLILRIFLAADGILIWGEGVEEEFDDIWVSIVLLELEIGSSKVSV
jgi:hypothetical protein